MGSVRALLSHRNNFIQTQTINQFEAHNLSFHFLHPSSAHFRMNVCCVCACVRKRADFLHRSERKIYDFTAKMRFGTAQTNGLFAVVIQREHIDNNNDDYNDSSTSLATLPTLPRNGSPYSTRPRLSLGPCQAAIWWIYYYYISWSLTHSTFLLGGTMLSMDSL